MNNLELLISKIDLMIEKLNQRTNLHAEESTKISNQIAIIEECLKAFNNEDLFISYDFSSILNLIAENNIPIEDFTKLISDIKNVLEIKKELNIELSLSENQSSTLRKLQEILNNIKEILINRMEEQQNFNDIEAKIALLKEFQEILTQKVKNKYYTKEMIEAFYEGLSLVDLTNEELLAILEPIYHTSNFRNKTKKEKVNFEDVLALYKEYIPENKFATFERLLNSHKEEIIEYIDLANTKEILECFKANNILEKFWKTTLLKVSLLIRYLY